MLRRRFKFNLMACMPLTGPWPLRAPARPQSAAKESIGNTPTPAWIFGDRSCAHEFIEQDEYISELEAIAKQKFGIR